MRCWREVRKVELGGACNVSFVLFVIIMQSVEWMSWLEIALSVWSDPPFCNGRDAGNP